MSEESSSEDFLNRGVVVNDENSTSSNTILSTHELFEDNKRKKVIECLFKPLPHLKSSSIYSQEYLGFYQEIYFNSPMHMIGYELCNFCGLNFLPFHSNVVHLIREFIPFTFLFLLT